MRERDAPRERFDAIAPVNRTAGIEFSPYQEIRFERLRQDQRRTKMFDQRDRQAFSHAASGDFYKGDFQTSGSIPNPGNFENLKYPVQPVYVQKMGHFQGDSRNNEDAIDCEDKDVKGSSFRGSERDDQRYKQRLNADGRRYEERIKDAKVE